MNPLDAWLAEAGDALGVDRDAMQRDLLLDLTRDVAHGVARPAAPLTAFLVGLAAGRSGGSADDVKAAIARLASVLEAYQPPPESHE
ncbi:MAG TPA: DUF6457 domain-containing protein [Frankiaceae bacterium]|jgi:hypothetical protein|nr:DUF6457 domain-containing protein [Frankiaceae bacterium]